MTIYLDDDRSADWPKRRQIDWEPPPTEETFRQWMDQSKITPEMLVTMPIFSPENRAQYPWLDDIARDALDFNTIRMNL